MKDTWAKESGNYTHLYVYKKLEQIEKSEKKKWKMIAIISVSLLLISFLVMIYAINLPRTVPMVITVSDWGEAKYVGEIGKLNYDGIKVPKIAIEYQIRKFVINKYSISSDYTVTRNNLKDCYASLTQTSAQKLSEELGSDNPLKNIGKVIKNVEIQSILNLSKNSYQVDFTVSSTSMNGKLLKSERKRGVLSIDLMEPAEEDKILNPLGIYITNFDFTDIKMESN